MQKEKLKERKKKMNNTELREREPFYYADRIANRIINYFERNTNKDNFNENKYKLEIFLHKFLWKRKQYRRMIWLILWYFSVGLTAGQYKG